MPKRWMQPDTETLKKVPKLLVNRSPGTDLPGGPPPGFGRKPAHGGGKLQWPPLTGPPKPPLPRERPAPRNPTNMPRKRGTQQPPAGLMTPPRTRNPF